MSVRSGQSVTTVFPISSSTGALVNADSLPAGTLYLNGAANGASVTVTNLATGVYKAAVTLPTLAVGDVVSIFIAATISTVAAGNKVWEDSKDVFAGAIPDAAAGASGGLVLIGTSTNTFKSDSAAQVTAGDLKAINSIATTSVTTISAVIGTATAGSTATAVAGVQTTVNTINVNTTGLSGVTFPSIVASSANVAAVTTTLEAYGDIHWATATGFATPTNVSDSTAAIETYGQSHWTTAVGFATPTNVTDAAAAVNIAKVNNVTVNGAGTTLSPWGP